MTQSGYKLIVEPFEDRHVAPYARLSRAEYGPDAAVSQPAHLRWKFLENPAGPAQGIHLYAGDELVARMTAMPRRFRFDGKTYTGAHLVDLLVHPQHRGMPPLLQLAQGLRELRGFDFRLLTPNEKAFTFWKTFVKMPAHFDLDVAVAPLRPAKLLHTAGKFPVQAAIPFVDATWRALAGTAATLSAALSDIAVCDAWPDRATLEALLQMDRPGHAMGERRVDFLEWRFRRSPVFKYDVRFLYRNRRLIGYYATRRQDYHGYDCRFLVDIFLAPDATNVGGKIVADIVRHEARGGGAAAVMAFGNAGCGPLAAAARWLVTIPEGKLPRKTTLFADWLSPQAFAFSREALCLTLADFDMI
jgi:hypothetical protein